MVPTIHKPGRGLAGLLAYVTHDTDNRETDDRVDWTEGINIPVDDGPSCGRIMAGTVRDAAALKAGAGISARGRKLKQPYEHLTLSWSPEEPTPTRAQMMSATREAIKTRGYAGCHTFVACHTDTDHAHVHVVICRINPKTGQVKRPTHARKLQRWAEQHEEKTRGRLLIPNRRDRRLVREHNGREIRAALNENRKPVFRELPPMKPRPVRDPLGRVTAPRTDEERQTFRQLIAAQQLDGTPPTQARRDRVALSRTQAEARVQAQRKLVGRALRTLTAPPAEAPAPLPPRPDDLDLRSSSTSVVVVVRDSSRAPDPPTPVVAAPARTATVVVRERSTAPDPPKPVGLAPARTLAAFTVRADTPTPPPAPPRPIDEPPPRPPAPPQPIERPRPRPTTTHDSKPVTRGADRQIGGAPAPSTRPPKALERL